MLEVIRHINDQLEQVMRMVPHTRSVYADRELGRSSSMSPRIASRSRYGLTGAEVRDVAESSIGGMTSPPTYEGRERCRINVRYPRELRDNIERRKNVLVPRVPRPRA
jgi:Cu(I)/Ag(I) efflux system membrane protein CusA/SilA